MSKRARLAWVRGPWPARRGQSLSRCRSCLWRDHLGQRAVVAWLRLDRKMIPEERMVTFVPSMPTASAHIAVPLRAHRGSPWPSASPVGTSPGTSGFSPGAMSPGCRPRATVRTGRRAGPRRTRCQAPAGQHLLEHTDRGEVGRQSARNLRYLMPYSPAVCERIEFARRDFAPSVASAAGNSTLSAICSVTARMSMCPVYEIPILGGK